MYQVSSSNCAQLHPIASHKRNRNRGVVLSEQGWQKLAQANVLHDELGNRYTYERLSERSLLNERTVSRILSCEVKVDKRTLKTFFAAFRLRLDEADYVAAERRSVEQLTTKLSLCPDLPHTPAYPIEANLSHQELIELYQRLVQDLRYLSQLLNLDEAGRSIQLHSTELN
ncbi:hypothetical protein H6F88_08585 [Oculatella sp. FACHB-28]|uniref:hypothetical protein n=1 Tax=Oculatella sp. FACHB-28 TaxID=2692845 RepID=UPI0016820B0A|nr:hypothetical protein [Oculatella sp. FACHB-28]MBD1870523.1 hypothetical protein [Cyanobacteria bacterium FACHB-471]MBD2056072.1 hypothetical protein [Oculatella sp. FACHB-28]